MRVIITGATGFIGSHLTQNLLGAGYDVIALTRNTEKAQSILSNKVACVEWDAETSRGWLEYVEGAAAIVNLAGAGIADSLWTEKYKQKIVQSRLKVAGAVVEAIQKARQKPRVLLQGSASGYYGDRGDEVLDENSAPGSEGFLVEVVKKWEEAVKTVEETPVRVAYLRTGIVLGRGEGILEKMTLPFKLFLGGTPGSGKQWFSWVHIQDQVNIIRYLLKNESLQGVFNLVSPDPVRMAQFTRELADVLNRPAWVPVPAFLLKLALAEMAEETALVSQRILPRRLMDAGYQYAFRDLRPALEDLID